MSRPDLASTLTKLSLWNLTQYDTIVYLDADTLPFRAPDELFDLDVSFAASPELGFPDCFNSGVMVLRPSKEIFGKLSELAAAGQTFDGGDQGLLNIHFGNSFHRLSFLYNIECSHVYHLYMPALTREREAGNWNVVHFIGKTKPWDWVSEEGIKYDDSKYCDMYKDLVSLWWEDWEKVTGKKRREMVVATETAKGKGSTK